MSCERVVVAILSVECIARRTLVVMSLPFPFVVLSMCMKGMNGDFCWMNES